MSCLGHISNLEYVCTTLIKDLLPFGPQQDHLLGGARLCGICLFKQNETRLGLGQQGSSRTKEACEGDMIPLPVLSHPSLGLTMFVLSSLQP